MSTYTHVDSFFLFSICHLLLLGRRYEALALGNGYEFEGQGFPEESLEIILKISKRLHPSQGVNEAKARRQHRFRSLAATPQNRSQSTKSVRCSILPVVRDAQKDNSFS